MSRSFPVAWYPILESRALTGRPRAVRRCGQDLVLYRRRSDGAAVALRDRCPHRGVRLSRGRVDGDGLRCAYHGFLFEADGTCSDIPCDGPGAHISPKMCAPAHEVREQAGLIWLRHGPAARAPVDLAGLEDTGCGASGAMDWPFSLLRSVESNFDLHHAPHLHRGILPGAGPRMVQPHCEVHDGRIELTGRLEHADGRGMDVLVRHQFPSVTYFRLARSLSFTVFDAPIDDDNTWRLARYHQDFLPVPGLGHLLARLLVWFEWTVVQRRQDLPMVETMRPRRYTPGCDRLVRADVGVAQYRKLYRAAVSDEHAPPITLSSSRAAAETPDALQPGHAPSPL